jgi:hypothetical protein
MIIFKTRINKFFRSVNRYVEWKFVGVFIDTAPFEALFTLNPKGALIFLFINLFHEIFYSESGFVLVNVT